LRKGEPSPLDLGFGADRVSIGARAAGNAHREDERSLFAFTFEREWSRSRLNAPTSGHMQAHPPVDSARSVARKAHEDAPLCLLRRSRNDDQLGIERDR